MERDDETREQEFSLTRAKVTSAVLGGYFDRDLFAVSYAASEGVVFVFNERDGSVQIIRNMHGHARNSVVGQ